MACSRRNIRPPGLVDRGAPPRHPHVFEYKGIGADRTPRVRFLGPGRWTHEPRPRRSPGPTRPPLTAPGAAAQDPRPPRSPGGLEARSNMGEIHAQAIKSTRGLHARGKRTPREARSGLTPIQRNQHGLEGTGDRRLHRRRDQAGIHPGDGRRVLGRSPRSRFPVPETTRVATLASMNRSSPKAGLDAVRAINATRVN